MFAFFFLIVLIIWGRQIRQLSPNFSTPESEESEHIYM
jgi:hypothetical protein